MSLFKKKKKTEVITFSVEDARAMAEGRYSGHLVRELDENNSEHFIRPERVFVKTKGELENGDKSDE